MMDNEQKTFRDFFGRDIKVKDKVLHLWATVTYLHVEGGASMIKHKVAKVIGFSAKGVRIEWKEKNFKPRKKSTIFNTRNRLIILRKADLGIDEEIIANEAIKEYESYKKGMITRIKNLKRTTEVQMAQMDGLMKVKKELMAEVKELTTELQRMKNEIYRFELIDFEE